MSKVAAIALILFVVAIMTFATWQFFLGRFEAAFAALPFLVICYFFVKPWQHHNKNGPPK